jgi:hypothetical protein
MTSMHLAQISSPSPAGREIFFAVIAADAFEHRAFAHLLVAEFGKLMRFCSGGDVPF